MQVEYLTNEQIRAAADAFLARYHPSRTIPTPIENIVESGLGIDIFPIPALHSNFDVDAFITSDLKTICVDEYMMVERENRYRFSLAHESAHAHLHAALFRSVPVATVSEWKDRTRSIDPATYARIEYQANVFAGCVLAPSEHLELQWVKGSSIVPQELRNGELLEVAYELVAGEICHEFGVSEECMAICLKRAKLGWRKL